MRKTRGVVAALSWLLLFLPIVAVMAPLRIRPEGGVDLKVDFISSNRIRSRTSTLNVADNRVIGEDADFFHLGAPAQELQLQSNVKGKMPMELSLVFVIREEDSGNVVIRIFTPAGTKLTILPKFNLPDLLEFRLFTLWQYIVEIEDVKNGRIYRVPLNLWYFLRDDGATPQRITWLHHQQKAHIVVVEQEEDGTHYKKQLRAAYIMGSIDKPTKDVHVNLQNFPWTSKAYKSKIPALSQP